MENSCSDASVMCDTSSFQIPKLPRRTFKWKILLRRFGPEQRDIPTRGIISGKESLMGKNSDRGIRELHL